MWPVLLSFACKQPCELIHVSIHVVYVPVCVVVVCMCVVEQQACAMLCVQVCKGKHILCVVCTCTCSYRCGVVVCYMCHLLDVHFVTVCVHVWIDV